MYQLIKGGASDDLSVKKSLTSQQKREKISQMKAHMRGIEANMAAINQQAKTIEWDELEKLVGKTHETILDVLRIIKQAEKKDTLPEDKRSKFKVIESLNQNLKPDLVSDYENNP